MAPASNEEQFKFLISCIRYSNNGKVDFGQVARECKIVSKGAAAKRYERMMKAHGIATNAATIKPAPARSSPKVERQPSIATSTSIKKRKAEAFLEDTTPVDDEEVFGNGNIKPERDIKEQFVVKEERERSSMSMNQGALSIDQAANLMQYYESPASSSFGGSSGMRAFGGNGNEYAGSSYTTSMSPTYNLPSQQQYDFSTSYNTGGLGGSGMSSSMNSGGLSSGGINSGSMNTGSMGGNNLRAGGSNAGGKSNVPRSENQGLCYHPLINYSSDDGRSDSPVIVE